MILCIFQLPVYAADENFTDSISLSEINLKNGETISFDDYEITYYENTVSNNNHISLLQAGTTTTYTTTSHYAINDKNNIAYDVVQITNYTYDFRTVTINKSDSKLSITSKTGKSANVTENTIANSNSNSATYTVAYTLPFTSKNLSFRDVVTVYANGTHSKAHYQ